MIPGSSPNLETQVQFVIRYHQLRAMRLKEPGIVQLFADGVHLVHQTIPKACWCNPKKIPTLASNSSRQRLNTLGAYDPIEQRFVHLTDETNCDHQKVIAFFEKLLDAYPDKHSIVLYLDNAPYFRAKEVSQWLEQHPQLIVEHLPTYSPNLNLIERLWAFVKRQLVANRYYQMYKTFRAKTFQLLNHLDLYNEALKTLVSENFELIWQT
jgi:transposase